ncbi:Signal transduction histidine kinase [Parapedobacter luteus]|uniref:histidine kinase n=1 Tax=Parapedobacter luteus TaxID=623280 RepID=A0A1T5FL05_9SPHI|nr:HAMP domain-containing sensor histidine kinase [Parapedobacter luteus]SKB96881.1 Signal transduction histidine kinase [Parapedobacter luteus]
MKLLNHTLGYLALALLFVVGLWGCLFFLYLRSQINADLDRNLNNYKLDIIEEAHRDSTVLIRHGFWGKSFEIHKATREEAFAVSDTYENGYMAMPQGDGQVPARVLYTAFELNGSYYLLTTSLATDEIDDLMSSLALSVVGLYLALLISILLLNNVILQRVWNPFYQLVSQVSRFQIGQNQHLDLPATGVTEFNKLNEAVSQLVQRTEETYRSQEEFTANVAHELQTPLAVSLNKLELLLERHDMTTPIAKAIIQVSEMLRRLTRLNKSLLMLIKIENHQFADSVPYPFDVLTEGLVSELEVLAKQRRITLAFHRKGGWQTTINSDLATLLITNLLKNAISHNYPGGSINLTVGPGMLEVRNSGLSNALDQRLIFERFHKGDASNQSSGLGLAIVSAICRLYHLTITYSYQDGQHVFKVSG